MASSSSARYGSSRPSSNPSSMPPSANPSSMPTSSALPSSSRVATSYGSSSLPSQSRLPTNRSSRMVSGNPSMVSSTPPSSRMASDVEVTSAFSTTTPVTTKCCGIPCTTLVGSLVGLFFYGIALLIVICSDCKLNRDVIYFIIFLLLAVVAMCCMIGINMMFTRYRFNFLSLSVSLFYSGTAFLVALSLITSAERGLCPTDQPEGTSIFKTSYMNNWFIWFVTLFGLLFQIVSHYFYG